MFTRLHIKDYQSIKEADLALEPFTVIVGKSRSGKSAALRALRAAIFNETGDDLIRWGQSQATVEVETAEGDTVIWTKTRTSAEYELNGNRYTKLAGAVPPDVADALGIRAIVVDTGFTLVPQFHEQGQYAFLIDRPSGQAAKALAKMTRLDIVVKAQQHCKSAIRDIKDRLKAAKIGMERLEPELDAWDTSENDRQIKWVDRATSTIIPLHNALFDHDAGHRAMLVLMAASALEHVVIDVDWEDLQSQTERIGDWLACVDIMSQDVPEPVDLNDFRRRADRIDTGFDAMIEEDAAGFELDSAECGLIELQNHLEEAEAELAKVKTCPVCGGAL